MSSFTKFSVHARIRADERLSMSEEDVALLLDHGLAVKISEEKNTNRIHLLFYSADDFQCFVAVYDQNTKTVITLLPIDYYEQLNHKVSILFVEEAKLKVSAQYDPSTDKRAQSQPADLPVVEKPAASTPSILRLTATYKLENGKYKMRNLGSLPAQDCELSEELLESKVFVDMLIQKIAEAAPLGSQPMLVNIRQGAKDAGMNVPFDLLCFAPAGDGVPRLEK